MAAGNTYVAIATNTLSSAAASVTFSSISGAYTDLVLVVNAKTAATASCWVTLNSDSGSNYSDTILEGDGSTAVSARQSNQTRGYTTYNSGPVSTNFSFNQIVNFMNYSNTTTYKTFLSRANEASRATETMVTMWRSTSAISSIVYESNSNFQSGSTFSLYGILAA
jgi:hypothetical protein